MSQQKVLVIGMGQVGLCLRDTQPENVIAHYLDRSQLDITDEKRVHEVIKDLQPDCVINAAAYTAVDKAEDEPELAFAVNEHGAKNIAAACELDGARMIHISTDFVFDGKKQAPYTPEDAPNPLNVYGASKLAGEKTVLGESKGALVVRTSWVFSHYGHNFSKTMLRLMADGKSLNIVNDQIGSPTSARSLAKYLWKLSDSSSINGIQHFSNTGYCSWYDFAKEIGQSGLDVGLLDSQSSCSPIKSEEFPQKAVRPRYSIMLASEANIAPWSEALREELELMQLARFSNV